MGIPALALGSQPGACRSSGNYPLNGFSGSLAQCDQNKVRPLGAPPGTSTGEWRRGWGSRPAAHRRERRWVLGREQTGEDLGQAVCSRPSSLFLKQKVPSIHWASISFSNFPLFPWAHVHLPEVPRTTHLRTQEGTLGCHLPQFCDFTVEGWRWHYL